MYQWFCLSQKNYKNFIDEREVIFLQKLYTTSNDIPYYHLKEPIQEILDSDDYKNNISDPKRIECKQAMYSVIQYSKFPWLDHAAKLNPFDSDIFFWLDAGGSRFFNNFDLTEPYPSKAAMESLRGNG